MPIQTENYTEAVDGSRSLGLYAAAVTIDNYSKSWAYLPSVGRFVPPLVYGKTFTIPTATQDGSILWRTPAIITGPPVGVPPGSLTAAWTDSPLPPSEGISVFAAQTQSTLLGSIAPVDGNTHTFPLPQGTQAIGVFSNVLTPSVGITVIGHQTAISYMNGAKPSQTNNIAAIPSVPIDPVDIAIDCTVVGGGNSTYWIVAFPYDPTANFLNVQPIGTPIGSGGVSGPNFGTLPGLPTSANILGGNISGAGTIITIPAGRTWYGSMYVTGTGAAAAGGPQIVGDVNLTPAGVLLQADLAPGVGNNNSGTLTGYIANTTGAGHIVSLALNGATLASASMLGILV